MNQKNISLNVISILIKNHLIIDKIKYSQLYILI